MQLPLPSHIPASPHEVPVELFDQLNVPPSSADPTTWHVMQPLLLTPPGGVNPLDPPGQPVSHEPELQNMVPPSQLVPFGAAVPAHDACSEQ